MVDGALIGHRENHPYRVKDNLPILEKMAELWLTCGDSPEGVLAITENVLKQTEWWGKDLRTIPGLIEIVTRDVNRILSRGIRAAMADVSEPAAGR